MLWNYLYIQYIILVCMCQGKVKNAFVEKTTKTHKCFLLPAMNKLIRCINEQESKRKR